MWVQLSVAAPIRGGGVNGLARQRIARGQFGAAILRLSETIAAAPSDDEALALLGVAHGGAGHHVDACSLLAHAEDTSAYAWRGLGAHARCVAYTGDGDRASVLRWQQLVDARGPIRELGITLEMVEDQRIAGNPGTAYDLALRALSVAPDRAGPHIALAQIAMDLGQWGDAGFHLWLAERFGPISNSLELAIARYLAWQGATQEAAVRLQPLFRKNIDDPDIATAYLELLTLNGDAATALSILERPIYETHQHPGLFAAHIRALRAEGEDEQADEVLTRARRLYPDHPWLREP